MVRTRRMPRTRRIRLTGLWWDIAVGTSRTLSVDAGIYSVDVVNKAAYSLSGLASFRIAQSTPAAISAEIAILGDADADDVVARFHNALVDFRVRAQLAAETAVIRDRIFRQAFVEADLEA